MSFNFMGFMEDVKTVILRRVYRAGTMEKYFEAKDRYDLYCRRLSEDSSCSMEEKRQKSKKYREETMKYGLLVSGDNWRKYEKDLHSRMGEILFGENRDKDLIERFPDEVSYLQKRQKYSFFLILILKNMIRIFFRVRKYIGVRVEESMSIISEKGYFSRIFMRIVR